jgi:putative intracellular protease/amidase
MQLVEKGSDTRLKVGILVFDGVQVIDFSAPYEVFGEAGFHVFTVSETGAPLTTVMNLKVTPAFSFANCPRPDVVLVPGGNVGQMRNNSMVLDWIRGRAAEASYVMSVCNGALTLAATGLLDGLIATTFHGAIEELRARHPRIKVVSDRRWADNGKFITTAGLSAGIDGALHVVSKLRGEAAAQMVALNMEYDWHPQGDYARAALADYPLRAAFGGNLNLHLPDGYRATVEQTEGNRKSWRAAWRVETGASEADLAGAISQSLQSRLHAEAEPSRNAWRYTDGEGRAWRLSLTVTSLAAQVKRAQMDVSLAA